MRIRINQEETEELNELPNQCPWCHKTIEPNYITASKPSSGNLELIYKCPSSSCSRLFIGYYYSDYPKYRLRRTNKGNLKNKRFSDSIVEASSSFVEIYNQAYFAEQNNLDEIAGVGYRKAIEFLIKDYLIKLNPEKELEIKTKFLGRCISENVIDEKIKSVAKRAVWLGNDETHYVRKWENKDLTDMKKLIDLTVHWIEMEFLTNSFESEMPE